MFDSYDDNYQNLNNIPNNQKNSYPSYINAINNIPLTQSYTKANNLNYINTNNHNNQFKNNNPNSIVKNNQHQGVTYFSQVNIPNNGNIISSISPQQIPVRNNPNNGNEINNGYTPNIIQSFSMQKPFNNKPSERLPYVDINYIGVPNRNYVVPMPTYPSIYDFKNEKPHVDKEKMKMEMKKKIDDENKNMQTRQKDLRNNIKNIIEPPPKPQEKKKNENDKINRVMEDMCIYGNVAKNEIVNEKTNNPEKYIPTEKALNNEQKDPGLFSLGLIASALKNMGVEAAIVNDEAILDKKKKEEKENSAITGLQFMTNGLLFKKKYEFEFDLDDNRVNEILFNPDEYEKFKEVLKEKLNKDFNIPKDKIIITFPQLGSLIVQIIIQSDEFNNISKEDFLNKFKNDENFEELRTLKKVHEGFLMGGCQLSRLQLDPLGNRSEWPQNIENRGGEPYYPPYGWIGIGLKVFDQYMDDRWMDMQNLEGEWVVAYHGLGRALIPGDLNPVIGGVVRMGFKNGVNQVHKNCEDFYHKGKKVGEGIYCTPFINIAEEYAGIAKINGKEYKIVIMVRVNPSARRHCNICEESRNCKYWVVNATVDEIRPYRILYKKCE